MDQNFNLALQLMGVGMITVFFILFFIIILGNVIIWFVNRFIPEASAVVSSSVKKGSTTIDPKIIAAIVSAVKTVTGGKGNVVRIERENK
jgi:oxaloacetate decarboxylase gamma subunit